ncbi:MAG: HAD family hydrolase [Pseudomonadota bacterium]
MSELQKINVSAILFDFGGCLDSNGVHTRHLVFNTFVDVKLLEDYDAPEFAEVWGGVDAEINEKGTAVNMKLEQMNQFLVKRIAKDLGVENQTGQLAEVARRLTNFQKRTLETNRIVVEKLSKDFSLGIISNFYGNLNIILEEFKMKDLFTCVVESYHAKVAKPSPAIFEKALKGVGKSAGECLMVGDNPERDILPAQKLGMKTVLIQSKSNRNKDDRPAKCQADGYISEVVALLDLVQKA